MTKVLFFNCQSNFLFLWSNKVNIWNKIEKNWLLEQNHLLVANWNVFDNVIGENFSLTVHRGRVAIWPFLKLFAILPFFVLSECWNKYYLSLFSKIRMTNFGLLIFFRPGNPAQRHTERVYECGAKQTLVVRSLLRLVIHSVQYLSCVAIWERE